MSLPDLPYSSEPHQQNFFRRKTLLNTIFHLSDIFFKLAYSQLFLSDENLVKYDLFLKVLLKYLQRL